IGYVMVEENGMTYYEDVAHQYRTTLGHADILLDGERIEGFTAKLSPVLSGTKNLFSFERSKPEFYMSMELPVGYMAEGGTYEREQFVDTALDCFIRVGDLSHGCCFSSAEEMERFDDIAFTFSPVSHDQPVAVQFYIAYSDKEAKHSIEGFAVVRYSNSLTQIKGNERQLGGHHVWCPYRNRSIFDKAK
ncbi:MAG: hypothetical protein RR505_14035, partial [Raoultibacter sp.]